MIHHLAFEIDKNKIPEELSFWACLGYHPTGLRRRTRKQPPIHWLVCGDENHAIELLPVENPSPQGLAHVCLSLDRRRWEIATAELQTMHPLPIEYGESHHGAPRFFVKSPSGYYIEGIQTTCNQLKAGPPLQEVP